MNGTDLMISLLGIIITLSIAYNFFNIWRNDNRIKELEATMKSYMQHVDDNVKELELLISKNKHAADLIEMNANILDDYRTNNWLMGLKHEFEILAFLCKNFEYFEDDFQGKIGIKRASVSSILLSIHDTFESKTIQKYNHETIKDCFRTVRRMWDNIYFSTSYNMVKNYEGTIFEDLSLIAETLFKQIENNDFPLHLPVGTLQKLQDYKTKFGN